MSGSSGEAATGSTAVANGSDTAEATAPTPSRGTRIKRWFAALLRSFVALIATLVVLAALAGAADVVLHVTRHSHTSTTSYSGVGAVRIVLDGDVSLNVTGRDSTGSTVNLSTTSTNTPFDEPVQTEDIVGGTLYLTERCPDSRCTAQLTLLVGASDKVDVDAGNALRVSNSVIDLNGLYGKVSVIAAPARVVVQSTVATGAVVGALQCDTEADCKGVLTPSNYAQAVVSSPK